MKKTLRLCAAIGMGIGMQFAAATGAFASSETGIADFIDDLCKPGVEAGTYNSVGECMGKNRRDVVNFCKNNFAAMAFRNYGSCERWAQTVINSNDY